MNLMAGDEEGECDRRKSVGWEGEEGSVWGEGSGGEEQHSLAAACSLQCTCFQHLSPEHTPHLTLDMYLTHTIKKLKDWLPVCHRCGVCYH